jgi:peptidoglycan hydrolase CwlO-like protein
MGRLKITQEDDSIRTVAYLDEVQDLANDVDANINKIENLTEDFDEHKEDYVQHLASEIPHLVRDLDNDKTYFFGLRIKDGGTQFMYKEVMVND